MNIKIKLIAGGKAPVYKTEGACCADCYARLDEDVLIDEGTRKMIPLGFAMQLPQGYEGVIRPRSGLSRNGIDEVVGTIDWDYTGEVNAIVVNNTKAPFVVHNGDRICQMKIQQAEQFNFVAVPELEATVRGDKGFGSTGV